MSLLYLRQENKTPCTNFCVHGSCELGHCICEVKYSGSSCKELNLGYYIGFGLVFYLISAISFFQLVFCIRAEFRRMARPSFLKACQVTIQKLLYVYVIVAAGSRGLYYTTEVALPEQWRVDLFAIYYPFVICCFFALICFWAEAFHIAGWTIDKPHFLLKSTQVFYVFNIFVFSVMIAQLISNTTVKDMETLRLLADIFSGCFVFLMFTVLIFFLIYGIEIFYKVEGAFKAGSSVLNWTQLNMSRVGLVSQAVFLLSAAVFFLCDVLQRKWKYRTDIARRNALEIVSRISELAVALWFPCVLWNCIRPKDLWILNPKKLIRSPSIEESLHEDEKTAFLSKQRCYNTIDNSILETERSDVIDCWVCYDAERTDAGLLIYPCGCKGDVASVHHECLKQWLLEVLRSSDEIPVCRVCKEPYTIQTNTSCFPKCTNLRHYLRTFFILIVMTLIAAGAYRFCVTSYSALSKVGFVGTSLLAEFVFFKWLGFSFVSAYQRVRMATIVIIGRKNISASPTT